VIQAAGTFLLGAIAGAAILYALLVATGRA
jgi:hypothetical protein